MRELVDAALNTRKVLVAGLTVCRHQRHGVRQLLDKVLAVANSGDPSAKRDGYRDWLVEPSETLRVILGQAGEDYERRRFNLSHITQLLPSLDVPAARST